MQAQAADELLPGPFPLPWDASMVLDILETTSGNEKVSGMSETIEESGWP